MGLEHRLYVVSVKLRVVDPCHAPSRTTHPGHLAGDDIDRLVGRHSHKQVGRVGPALHEITNRERGAFKCYEIASGIKLGQMLGIGAHQHYILILDRKHFGKMRAGLTVAGYDDSHFI